MAGRALAQGIDMVIHYGVGCGAGLVAGFVTAFIAAFQGRSPDSDIARLSAAPLWGYVAAMLGSLLMHTLSEGLHGSTLGKRICGIVVIGEDGSPASITAAFKRSLAFYWDGLFFGLIAYERMSRSPKRQRVGDAWGKTMVVQISAVPPPQHGVRGSASQVPPSSV